MPDTILGTYAPSDSNEALALDAACAQGGALRLSFRRPTFHARASAYPEHVILTARLDGRPSARSRSRPSRWTSSAAPPAPRSRSTSGSTPRPGARALRPPRREGLAWAQRHADLTYAYAVDDNHAASRVCALMGRGSRWLRLPRLPVGEPAPARGSGPGGLLRGGARGALPRRGPLRPPRGPRASASGRAATRVRGSCGLRAGSPRARPSRTARRWPRWSRSCPRPCARRGCWRARGCPGRGGGRGSRATARSCARGTSSTSRPAARSSEPISCGTWPGKRASGASTGATSSTPAATACSGPCARTFRASSHRSCAVACSCGASTGGPVCRLERLHVDVRDL